MYDIQTEVLAAYVFRREFDILFKTLSMKIRKHNIARNILRVFEIALFFAISVLGYGLLVKTSSNGSSKSKSRDNSPGIQRTVDNSGAHQELMQWPEILRGANDPALTFGRRALRHVFDTDQTQAAFHFPQQFQALHLQYGHPNFFTAHSTSLSLPYNLLQQNPVLLV
jgi:hypothetical protein